MHWKSSLFMPTGSLMSSATALIYTLDSGHRQDPFAKISTLDRSVLKRNSLCRWVPSYRFCILPKWAYFTVTYFFGSFLIRWTDVSVGKMPRLAFMFLFISSRYELWVCGLDVHERRTLKKAVDSLLSTSSICDVIWVHIPLFVVSWALKLSG